VATIIDRLVVMLGLDPKPFVEGSKKVGDSLKKTKDQAVDTGKEMDLRTRRSIDAYAKFRGEVIALFAAFTAGVGLKQFVGDTIKSEASLGRLSRSLGQSVETLSAWQGLMRRNGGTAEDATAAFRTMAEIQNEIASTGTTSKGGLLMNMGITGGLAEINDSERAIFAMARRAREMNPVIAAARLQQIGFRETFAQAMLKGDNALRQQLELSRQLGVTTWADVEAAARLLNVMEGLNAASARLGAQLLTVLEPAIVAVTRGMTWLATFAQKNRPIMVGFFVAIIAMVGALTLAMVPLIAEFWALLAPMLPIVAAIAAVAIGLGALYELVTQGTHAFLEFLRSNQATRDALDELEAAFGSLWQAIQDLFAALKPAADAVAGAFSVIGKAITDAFGPLAQATVKGFVSYLVGQFHILSDMVRTVAALLRGDIPGALAAATDFLKDKAALDAGAAPRASRPAAPSPLASRPSAPPSPATAPATAPGSPRARVVQFMRAKGFTQAQAEGIAAGIEAESGFRTGAFNPAGGGQGAFGIGQWRGPRLAELRRRYGPNPSFAQQLEFLAWELMGGDPGGKAVRAASTSAGALNAYITSFMRPKQGRETTGDLERGMRALASNSNLPPAAAELASAARARSSSATPSATARGGDTNTLDIGQITVVTQATDANGIARDIGGAIQRRPFVPQVNTGLG
jgi:hypothetical protein